MTLAAVDIKDWNRWGQHPTSSLKEHQSNCCRNARNWVLAMARSFEFRITEQRQLGGMRWLTTKYQWGPNPWPLHWCEMIERSSFDCGVFAAISREIFLDRGISAYAGQVVLRANDLSVAHYENKWRNEPDAFRWTGKGFVYHEVVIVESQPGIARIYDATENRWLKPESILSHETPIAIRQEGQTALRWGNFMLYPDQWCELGET